ncbi:MAG: tetratricopeptide repeat protein [Anaerolineae bacterium]|nr:tetratricopeptide repeat protein [Anaerolineae bacterium]
MEQHRESETIQAAILALERQCRPLGDAIVDAAVLALREKLIRLKEPLPAVEKRKQITVLFADVTDFTRLSESLDPEEVTELLNLLWQHIDRLILQRGGRIDKHMGDAVMAFWGADQAREDDAEQAIRTALEIKALIQELRPQVTTPIPLDLCIGISTGPVVLGTLSTTGEYTAIGPTVNLAYRLEGVAPVGGILISQDTYQHVRGLFQSHALPPLNLKGFADPIQAYQIIEAHPQAYQREARGIEGTTLGMNAAQMVGRQVETERLQAAYQAARTERRAQIVSITGEAGIGKSRLVQEFGHWALQQNPPAQCFTSRAHQETQALPYAMLRNMLSWHLGIYENDRSDTIRNKLEKGIGEYLIDPEIAVSQAHTIGSLLGFGIGDSPYLEGLQNDPEQLYYRAIHALLEFFKTVCSRSPLLLVLEDLHWADSSSLQLLNWLIHALAETPLLVISITRTEAEQTPLPLQFDPLPVQHLQLKPLNQHESRRLIAAILSKMPNVPLALEELITNKAQGNPFYIEELVQSLVENHIILRTDPQWQVDLTRLVALNVPQTLTGLLQARFDALPKPMQETLRQAAVIGPLFWTAAVEALAVETPAVEALITENTRQTSPAASKEDCVTHLELLTQRGILIRHPDSMFVGTQEYAFRHVLMHEVVYESTVHRLRRAYHARAAGWFSSHNEERAGDLSGWVAEHYLNAGAKPEAIAALLQAGQQASARFANEQAIEYFTRALTLTEESDSKPRYALYLALEAVFEATSDSHAQQQVLTTLEGLVEQLDDSDRRLEVALRQAVFSEATGDYPAAIAAANRAITLAQMLQNPCQEAEGRLLWGRALARQGHYATAQQQLKRASALLQTLDQSTIQCSGITVAQRQKVLADINRALGVVHWYQGQYDAARLCYETALQLYQEVSHPRGEAQCLNNLGVLTSDSDPDEGLNFHRQALAKYREIGNRSGEGSALSNIASLLVTRGELDTARTAYLQTLELRRAAKDRWAETVVLSNLGEIALQRGQFEEARSYFEQSLQCNREIGNRQGVGGNLGNLGITALQRGDYVAAYELLEQSLASARELGLRRAECDLELALCQLHHEKGDLVLAQQIGEHALQIARELRHRVTEAEVLIELGYIRQQLGEAELARADFQTALDIQREMRQYHLTLKSRAALAQLALEQGATPGALALAQTHAEDIWHALQNQILSNTDSTARVYLACYRVFAASEDERADLVLEQAYQLLQERAAGLPDENDRRQFLEAIPANRNIVVAWHKRHL